MVSLGDSRKDSAYHAKTAKSSRVAALGFLAAESGAAVAISRASGLGPHNLRAAAADPGFLAAVLDYLLADEPLLIAFAADQGIGARSVVALGAARRSDGPP